MNVFARCCGRRWESIAVDTTGPTQVAFDQRVANGTSLYEPLGADLDADGVRSTRTDHTTRRSCTAVADHSGNTFLAWPLGYPTAGKLSVVLFRGGLPAATASASTSSFSRGDPRMALSVDSVRPPWVVWTGGGSVHAAGAQPRSALRSDRRAAAPGTSTR